nr:hypothetical protein [Tanacetum cinerariifolium]
MLENGGIQVAQNAVQNAGVQSGGNQNGFVVVPEIANHNGTGNVVAARAEGTGNGNQARCYNCRGLGHIARNCTARPRRKDAAYLQTQLLIAQKEEAGIQLQSEEFDFMAAAGDLDEIKEVNANCILMANLQHTSTSGTQLDKAPVYDTDSSAECHRMTTKCTSVALSMVQSGGTVETSFAPNEETRAHQETVYRNLVDQVAKRKHLNLLKRVVKKMRFLKKEIKPAVSGVFVPQTTKSKEELFLSNVSNMVIVSKMISIPNEDLSDDTTPSVARKFLNEVKSSLVTLERVVKQKMTLEVHNWSSSAHKEISNDKAYNDMQQKVEQLQAQLRDLKGKSSDTPSASSTLDPLNWKLESKIVELEFQVVNYEREISHLKTTYKNLFDSITSNRAHAKLHNLIYKNAQLTA